MASLSDSGSDLVVVDKVLMNVQSIAVSGGLRLSILLRGSMFEWSVTSPGLSVGNVGRRSSSSYRQASLEGMKFACGPIVDVMKCVVLHIWLCSFLLLCFMQEKK